MCCCFKNIPVIEYCFLYMPSFLSSVRVNMSMRAIPCFLHFVQMLFQCKLPPPDLSEQFQLHAQMVWNNFLKQRIKNKNIISNNKNMNTDVLIVIASARGKTCLLALIFCTSCKDRTSQLQEQPELLQILLLHKAVFAQVCNLKWPKQTNKQEITFVCAAKE